MSISNTVIMSYNEGLVADAVPGKYQLFLSSSPQGSLVCVCVCVCVAVGINSSMEGRSPHPTPGSRNQSRDS